MTATIPDLPDGYRWKIGRSWLMGREWVKVRLQKRTVLGTWRTVRSDETKPEYFKWDLALIKLLWFDRKQIAAKRRIERAETRNTHGIYGGER